MPKFNLSEQNENKSVTSFSKNDVTDAGQITNLLLLAWKSYSLYPEGHNAAVKALENLNASFENFFSRHNSLRFTIGKNKLLWNNKVLHEVPSDNPSEDLVSMLYRDGIQWLEFHHDLPLDELIYFFSTLKKHRILSEEAEGDIVTCLNDGNLEHIDFKAIDIFWEDLPLLDFSTLNSEVSDIIEPGQQDDIDESENLESRDEKNVRAKSIADPSLNSMLWKISPAEQEELQKMVQEEENWDNREDVLDVLLIILRSQTDRYNFSSVLDFAMEEIIETIRQGEFSLLLHFFQSLYQLIYRDTSTEFDWRRPVIEVFFQDLSRSEIFDHITTKLITLNDANTEEIQILREILLYFTPAVVVLLAPVILQTKSPAIKKMILDVIEYLCLRDMDPVATLLDHPDHKLAEKILPVLSKLRGERSYNIFLKMSEHPSELVRREGIKLLLNRDPQLILKLFHLIEDPSFEIRKLILSAIAKQRSTVLENLILKHIKKNIENQNTDYLLACYNALGHCGSDKTIPYLSQVLLNKGWNKYIGLGQPVHREGAAIALALLGSQQAEKILLKASISRFKVIKDAFQKAMQFRDASGEKING